MLRIIETHESYQDKLVLLLTYFLQVDRLRVVEMAKSISKLYLLNLDNLIPVIRPLYSGTGCPARNQLGIIRSLVLMLDQDIHSITKWAKKVASDRILCAVCGFDFDDVPSFSSYYDLINRLWLSSHKIHTINKKRLKSFYNKPRKKLKAGQKLPPKHNGAVKKFAKLALKNSLPKYHPERIFQEFLARCIVDKSSHMGILGDTKKFSIAADGTCFYSGASHLGVKTCDCKDKGIYNCKCKRRYSDPDARWGWDSYREQWFYGDTLFNITASDSPYDLPIYLRSVQAQRHDSITFIFALSEALELYHDLSVKNVVLDGAMDNYPTYELLYYFGAAPFIPLDSNTNFNPGYIPKGVLCFDDKRNPVCMGGIPYQCCGYSYPKGIKYRCYFHCKGIDDKPCKCSDSSYGRTIYIKPEFDFRLFTPVPRNSDAWKHKMKTRTSVERSHKRIFEDYNIEDGRCRSSKHRFCRATMAAVNVHLDAWIKHMHFNLVDSLEVKLKLAA